MFILFYNVLIYLIIINKYGIITYKEDVISCVHYLVAHQEIKRYPLCAGDSFNVHITPKRADRSPAPTFVFTEPFFNISHGRNLIRAFYTSLRLRYLYNNDPILFNARLS